MSVLDITLYSISIISLWLALVVLIKAINIAVKRYIGLEKIHTKKNKYNLINNKEEVLQNGEGVKADVVLKQETASEKEDKIAPEQAYEVAHQNRSEDCEECKIELTRMCIHKWSACCSPFSQMEKYKEKSQAKSNIISLNEKRIESHMHVMLVNVDSEKVIGIVQEFPCIVGRGDNADVIIKDDSLISRTHLAIIYEKEHLYALDLHSTNGTIINGNKISSEYEIKDGNIVQIGQTKIKIMIIIK